MMLTPKSSWFGTDYGQKKLLYPWVETLRQPNIGMIMKDPGAEGHSLYYNKMPKMEQFPAVYSRRVNRVRMCGDHILYDDDFLYTDNLITAKFAHSTEAFRQVVADHSEVAVRKEKEVSWVERIETPVIVTSNEGSGTWGHWLIHNFPKIAIARASHPECKILVPAPYYGGTYENFGRLLKLIGVSNDDCIPIFSDRRYELNEIIIVDFLYTSSVHPYTVDLFDEISEKCLDERTEQKVYIQRSTPGKREITNSDRVLNLLSKKGFSTQQLGSMPLENQISAWRHGREFCSILGSDFTNIVFGRTGSSVLSLTPSGFNDSFFFDLATARGMIWNELVCAEISIDRSGHGSDFVVSELAMQYFLEGYKTADMR